MLLHLVRGEPAEDQGGAGEEEEVDQFSGELHAHADDPTADEYAANREKTGANCNAARRIAK